MQPPPTFHGALAANGLKGAYLIQIVRVIGPAHPLAGSLDRMVRGFIRLSGAAAPIKVRSRDIPDHKSAARPSPGQRNFDSLTPVQTAVLANDAAGRDLLVSAQTGSGKTVAYGLAIAAELLGEAERFERAGAPLALIVAPTRELALQVHRELAWLYQYADARVVSCVGGMDPRREQRELAADAHIVVGTRGGCAII